MLYFILYFILGILTYVCSVLYDKYRIEETWHDLNDSLEIIGFIGFLFLFPLIWIFYISKILYKITKFILLKIIKED